MGVLDAQTANNRHFGCQSPNIWRMYDEL